MSLTRALLRRAVTVVLGVVLAVTVGLVGALILIPKVMGWVPLTVLTGSMKPTIPPGSSVVVKRIEALEDTRNIGLGDIISFMPHPGDPMLVTHRVIAVNRKSDGNYSFVTQGDNNPSPDAEPVRPEQIRGIMLYHVPLAGYLPNSLSTSQKGTGLTILAVALFLYAAWQVVTTVRSTLRKRAARRSTTECRLQ
jgi:signal peptidase